MHIKENLSHHQHRRAFKRGDAFHCSCPSPRHQQRLVQLLYTADRARGAGCGQDTHLPYTVLVQRWWWSTLWRRVARRSHFQVTVGAAAPGLTFFRATCHSVSGWLLLLLRGEATRPARGPFAGARWRSARGLRVLKARQGPGSFCGVTVSQW